MVRWQGGEGNAPPEISASLSTLEAINNELGADYKRINRPQRRLHVSQRIEDYRLRFVDSHNV